MPAGRPEMFTQELQEHVNKKVQKLQEIDKRIQKNIKLSYEQGLSLKEIEQIMFNAIIKAARNNYDSKEKAGR